MKRLFFPLFFLLTLNAFAQQTIDPKAKALLDKATQALQKTTGVSADFTLTLEDGQTSQKQAMNGSLLLKGNKFKLSVQGAETYFDGRNQWVYLPEQEEVTISTPNETELQDINPTAILSSYRKGYKMTYEGERTEGGKTVCELNLYPNDFKKDFFRINLKIEKDTYNLISVKSYSKSGTSTAVVLKKYQTNVPIDDSTFAFKPATGVEIIDLR